MKPADDELNGDADSEQIGDRVRIYRRGSVWYMNYQHDGRQHRESLKTTSKKQARRLAVKKEADLAAGRCKPEVTIGTISEGIAAYRAFLEAEERAPKTLSKYNKVLERVTELAQERGHARLSSIDLKFVDAYRQMRADEAAQAKTRYTETVIIRQLVNFALSREMLAYDPLKGLKLKKPKPTPQPCWTFEELRRILAASPLEIKPALILLAETGMRFGEMAWLTWEDFDPQANVLRVQPKDGWKPKTGDQRAIPVTPAAKELLESLPRRWRWIVTMPRSPRLAKDGRQWTERRLLAALKRVLKGFGLEGKLHTFRHTFISNALIKGTPVAVVREWVGHVDPEIIDHYTHVHNDASQAAMRRLAQANQDQKETDDETGS